MNSISELVNIHNNWSYLEEKKNPKNIYHYTSKEGLDGILSGGRLWANDIYRQNDRAEGVYVLNLVKQNIDALLPDLTKKETVIKMIKELYPKLLDGNYYSEKYRSFIISFSTKQDELALWNYYTKSPECVGYNIKFDVAKLIPSFATNYICRNSSCGTKIKELNSKHRKVIYSPKIQIDILKKIVNDFYKIDCENDAWAYLLIDKILWTGLFFKSPFFKHEYEYRIAFLTQTSRNKENAEDIPIEYEGKKNHLEIYYNLSAVMGINCSPTCNETQRKYAERYISPLFPGIKKVDKSHIQFRMI